MNEAETRAEVIDPALQALGKVCILLTLKEFIGLLAHVAFALQLITRVEIGAPLETGTSAIRYFLRSKTKRGGLLSQVAAFQ